MHTTAADPALATLRRVFGYGAFRGAQHEIIQHLRGGGDALVLMFHRFYRCLHTDAPEQITTTPFRYLQIKPTRWNVVACIGPTIRVRPDENK